MKITSPSFNHNEQIPSVYTCDGSNISPPLIVTEVPKNTATLALVMDDPDAPGGVFTHWLIWNIDPNINMITESLTPDGSIRGTNGFGNLDYGGPCPPSGTHHYHFKIFALDTKLNLETGSDRNDFNAAIEGHIIDQSEIIGVYTR